MSRKKRYHLCCQLVCGRGIQDEPPPPYRRLLCGRGIEAQPPPLSPKDTHNALCYVSRALPLTLPLEFALRVLHVLGVLGVAYGTACGV